MDFRNMTRTVLPSGLFGAMVFSALMNPSNLSGQQRKPRPFRMSGGNIIVDTFDVEYRLKGDRLQIAVRTDLGDPAVLMVSVSRSYQERGSDETYPIDYFSEKSTVGAWRHPRTIQINNTTWRSQLAKRQRTLAAAGEPFTVSRIDGEIQISLVVPVRQKPPFRPLNANLKGKVVKQEHSLRIIEKDVSVPYSLDDSKVGQAEFGDLNHLQVGKTYSVPAEIPLMPSPNPADPLAAIAATKHLRAGRTFTVLEARKQDNTPWYRVRTTLGVGWINSTALIGKVITVVR